MQTIHLSETCGEFHIDQLIDIKFSCRRLLSMIQNSRFWKSKSNGHVMKTCRCKHKLDWWDFLHVDVKEPIRKSMKTRIVQRVGQRQ